MTVIQLLSFSVAILSVLAILVARRALYNGLAHSALMAMLWALVFIAIGRIWNLLNIILRYGFWGDLIEQGIYVIAFVLFIILALRGRSTPSADEIRKKHGIK